MRLLPAAMALCTLGSCANLADLVPPAAPVAAATVADERLANDQALRTGYLPWRAALRALPTEGWLAVANGRVVPTEDGVPAPVTSLEAAAAEALRVAPHARHRYVFRVGEEGDVEWPLGGCELAHVMGVRFIGLLERDDVEMRALGPRQPIRARFGKESREITVKGPDDRMFLRPHVGPPGAEGEAGEIYCLGTGFAGTATLTPASARGLELWEIPGSVTVEGAFRSGRCRRARARFTWPGSALDFTVPVAVWP